MFAATRRRVLSKRRRALKSIDLRFLALAESYIDKALFFRRAAKSVDDRGSCAYKSAMRNLIFAEEVLDAHLKPQWVALRRKSVAESFVQS